MHCFVRQASCYLGASSRFRTVNATSLIERVPKLIAHTMFPSPQKSKNSCIDSLGLIVYLQGIVAMNFLTLRLLLPRPTPFRQFTGREGLFQEVIDFCTFAFYST